MDGTANPQGGSPALERIVWGAGQEAADLGIAPWIPDAAHLRRARGPEPEYGMLRRGYNCDDGAVASGTGAGLIFAAFQADVDRQYIPVQDRLAASDHLNLWTRPVGSAVFAIPPGCAEGGFVGDVLFA